MEFTWTASTDAPHPAVVYEPEVAVSPGSVSELAADGVRVTGAGFPEDAVLTVTVDGVAVDTLQSSGDGDVSYVFRADGAVVGVHTVVLSSGEWSAQSSFEVTADPVVPGPVTIPGNSPDEADLDAAAEGGIQIPAQAMAGDYITVRITGVAAGTDVGAWIFSDPVYLGTHTLGAEGAIVVQIPEDTVAGTHRIAVWAEDATLIGWASLEISDVDDGSGDSGGTEEDEQVPDGDGTDDDDGGLAVTGGAQSPSLLVAGTVLVAFGGAIVLWRRRFTRA